MTEVKMCGMTNEDDARAALDLGADYLGFVLYRPSPRGIEAARLPGIIDRLDAGGRVVGVFVNERRAFVEQVAGDCGMAAVQLHGDEVAADFKDFPAPVWRAVKSTGNTFVPSPGEWDVERYVVDANVPGSYGGTGATADWNLASELASNSVVMLSGGLTPDNVVCAISQVRPTGVDAASGLEREPGLKDHELMKLFMQRVRSAE